MIKILFLLFFFISSNLIAEELRGLFGLELGTIFDEKNKLSTYDLENIKKISNLEVLDNLGYSEAPWYFYNMKVKPAIENKDFYKYYVNLSPLSKKIISVTGWGKGNVDKKKCIEVSKTYFSFFKKKYSNFYYSIHGSQYFDKFTIEFKKNKTPFNNEVLSLKEKIFSNTGKDEDSIVSQEISINKLDIDITMDKFIRIQCNNNFLRIDLSNVDTSLQLNETKSIKKSISLQRKRLTLESVDTSGL